MLTHLNIVVIEDHDALRDVTVTALASHGHKVIGLDCAEALYEHPGIEWIDLMIIDLNLPGEGGLSLTHRIRKVYPNIGIIIVSANSLGEHKRQGYENGADIYLTKPTSLDELNAAVNALARRLRQVHQPHAAGPKLCLRTLTLENTDVSVKISQHEASVLIAFIRAADRRLESWQLLELMGGNDHEYTKASLEVAIVRLRKKLIQAGAASPPIKAIRNYGYQLCTELALAD
jgi:two-component system, OmpR family, response regulator